MRLYIVRHAIAYERDSRQWPDDRDRPLTDAGKQRFRRAAAGLGRLVPAVDLVLSSRLKRAWQTAAILKEDAGWPAPAPCEALEPEHFSPGAALAAIQPHARAGSIALVGHEPSLSELVSYLLAGDQTHISVEMKKGGVACIELGTHRHGGAGTLLWLAAPKLLRLA
jgi:phosphohistidine phosphatase